MMKKITKKDVIFGAIGLVLVAAVVTFAVLWGTGVGQGKDEKSYYQRKCDAFLLENAHLSEGQIVFIGDSITDRYALDAAYASLPLATYNRGIGGDTTSGLLARLELSLFALKPTVISLLIGINDINGGASDGAILANYQEILDRIRERLPDAKVYCLSILPVNEDLAAYKYDPVRVTQRIPSLNAAIRSLAEERGYEFVDLYPLFADEEGHLIRAYSVDGIHLSPAGYAVWTNAFKPKLS